jgi:hypothetical protein
MHTCQAEENIDQAVCIKDDIMTAEDKIAKSRCMFEETYMINISVKQPDATPKSKQINVRIEKTPADTQAPDEKTNGDGGGGDEEDDDEISSIFDEDENDEIDSVIFNEMNSSANENPPTNLTLADMINKTLTTIPTTSVDNLNNLNKTNNWFTEQQNEVKPRPMSEHIPSTKPVEQAIKTPPPTKSLPSMIQTPTLTTNRSEDEKLFEYLDYLETKEESNQPITPATVIFINSI